MKVAELDSALEEALRDRLATAAAAAVMGTGLSLGLPSKSVNVPPPSPTMSQEPVRAASTSTAPLTRLMVRPATNHPQEAQLLRAAEAAGIHGTELAQFMAQCKHETINFTRLRERTDGEHYKLYEPLFRKNLKTKKIILDPETGKPHDFNPKSIALGNIKSGDGLRYLGRGFLQITGRYNYRKAGEALGLPLEDKPELMEDPDVAAKAAIWFWKHRVRAKASDPSNTREATRQVNPGMHGLEAREDNYRSYLDRMLKVNL